MNSQMVNNVASLRGRVKERVRSFVESEAGFKQDMKNQEVHQENLRRFNLRYPNSFHCKVSVDLRANTRAYMLIFRCG